MKMGKEVKLCLALMLGGDEVPASIKEAALEELRILAMHYGEGDVELYIAERLIDAVEKEDADAIRKAADLVRTVLDGEDARTNGTVEAVGGLTSLAMSSVDRFVDEADGKIRAAIVRKLTEQGVLPMFYEHGFMLLFGVEDEVFVLASVNGAHEDKHVLKDLFENMPGRTELLNGIRDITGSSSYEILFGRLEYKLTDDGILSVLFEEM